MSNVFLEFKERQNKLRLIKTAMIGGASGVGVGGLCLIFTKLDLLGIAPIFSLPIGIAALLIAGVVAYFALPEPRTILDKLKAAGIPDGFLITFFTSSYFLKINGRKFPTPTDGSKI